MKEADTSDARDPPPHHAIPSSPLWRARIVGDQLDEGAKFPLATIRLSPSVCARRPLPQRASSVFFLSSAPILVADSWTWEGAEKWLDKGIDLTDEFVSSKFVFKFVFKEICKKKCQRTSVPTPFSRRVLSHLVGFARSSCKNAKGYEDLREGGLQDGHASSDVRP